VDGILKREETMRVFQSSPVLMDVIYSVLRAAASLLVIGFVAHPPTLTAPTLPTVWLADTPSDKPVFGVMILESLLPEVHWYKAVEGERFGFVSALGEGRVWVTNLNGDIEAGDYITSSVITGYGQKQSDDLLHSSTLGKETEDVD